MQNTQLSLILRQDHSWRDEHRAEDDYLVQLRALSTISPEFVPVYSFNHTLPAFSSKIRYHERKFHNAVTDYLNRFRLLLVNPDESYIAFHLKKHNERTRVALNAYYTYLSQHKDVHDGLTNGSCYDYFSERTVKESVTLASYMFWALIWCNMEVQHLFASYIQPDNILTIDDHFYRLLMIAPIKPYYVHSMSVMNHTHTQVAEAPNLPSAETLASYLPNIGEMIVGEFKAYAEKIKPVGFFNLSKVQALSKPNQAVLIRELQTADKPFRFAMAYYLGWYGYMEDKIVGYQESGRRAKFFADLFEVGEREAKGFINVLQPKSKEDQERYNTRTYLADVETFYNNLYVKQ